MKKFGSISIVLYLAGILCIAASIVSALFLKPIVKEQPDDSGLAFSVDDNSEETESAGMAESTEAATEAESAAEVLMASSVTFDHKLDDEEYAVITGLSESGEKMWEYTTESYEPGQLDKVCEIGVWDDLYIFVQDGTVYALDMTTGGPVWTNSDFRGSGAAGCFSEDTAFLCGYMGPDVMMIDRDGNTVSRIDNLDDEHYWPYAMSFSDGTLTISYECNDEQEEEAVSVSVSELTSRASEESGSNAGGSSSGGNAGGSSSGGNAGGSSSGGNAGSGDSAGGNAGGSSAGGITGSGSSTGSNAASAVSASGTNPMDELKDVSASSYLTEEKYDQVHGPKNVTDDDLDTAWVEDVEGNGEGESITYTFNSLQQLSGFSIYNGYQKNSDLYNKNSRPSKLELTFSDGSTMTFDIADKMGEQTFTFEQPVSTNFVEFTIVSVYDGYKYTDTCISELAVY